MGESTLVILAMIERRDTPAPFMQRRPPPPLDLRPAMKHMSHSDSPPHTPPYRIRTRGQRASKAYANQPTPRETYLDGHKDGGHAREGAHSRPGGAEHRNERISHDLSLSDYTRHSVVDHMLLSLNPDQPKLFSTPPETRPFSSSSRFTSPRGSHRRGHTQSSSLNTDYAYGSDDSPARSLGQLTRGRRSHSSSNVQSALARINSLQGGEAMSDRTREAFYQAQRATARENRSLLRKGTKGSKSSGSSSVDFGRLMGQPQRWQSRHTRRSSSLDPSYRDAYRFPLQQMTNSSISHSISQPIDYDDLEAAPTPTVPVGPRSRDRSPAFPPPPAHAPPQAPSLHRKNSTKSSKGYNYSRRNKGGIGGIGNREYLFKENAKIGRGSQHTTSFPGYLHSRNTSPARYQPDMPVLSRQVSGPQVKDPPKERQGFFRRVFGSSRNVLLSTPEARSTPIDSARESIRGESRNGFSSPHKLSKAPPNENTPPPAKENVPPTLTKKPSSFFRRRKKSVSIQNQAPLIPLHLQPHVKPESLPSGSEERPSSPVSSLREVMNPFLNSATPSPANWVGSQAQAREENGGAVATSHQEFELDDHGSSVTLDQRKPANSLPRESPRTKTKLAPKIIPSPLQTEPLSQNSFRHNKSSTEINMTRSDHTLSGRPATSTSVDVVYIDGKYRSVAKSKPGHPLQPLPLADVKFSDLRSRDDRFDTSQPTSTNHVQHTEEQDWLPLSRPTTGRKAFSPPNKSANSKAWLEPAESQDDHRRMNESDRPTNGAEVSPVSEYHSAASTLRTAKLDDPNHDPETPTGIEPTSDTDPTVPSPQDRLQAKKIYDGDENFVIKAKAAAWLGEADSDRTRVRRAYMELFNWHNLNILAALRDFCSRLLLKGETQQVDRILDAFSSRWCVCNPNHGFKATGMSLRKVVQE